MDPRNPTDAEMLDTYRRCIVKGQQLHEKLKSWDETDIPECPSMQELYRVSQGYLDTPEGIWEEVASVNVNTAIMLWVDVESKK